jgi:hypothetical protein
MGTPAGRLEVPLGSREEEEGCAMGVRVRQKDKGGPWWVFMSDELKPTWVRRL